MSEGPAVAIFAEPETMATVEAFYALLTARCRVELAGLPPAHTEALIELVTLIEEGLAISAAAQTPTHTN